MYCLINPVIAALQWHKERVASALVRPFACRAGVAAGMTRADVSAPVVGVVKVPVLAGFDGLPTSCTCCSACCNGGRHVGPGTLVGGTIAALVGVAPLSFILGVMLDAVPLGYWLGAAWPATDALSTGHDYLQ